MAGVSQTAVYDTCLIGYARVSKADGSQLIRERTKAGLMSARTQSRQEVRAVESPGAAGPSRDGSKKAMFPTGSRPRCASSVPLQPSG